VGEDSVLGALGRDEGVEGGQPRAAMDAAVKILGSSFALNSASPSQRPRPRGPAPPASRASFATWSFVSLANQLHRAGLRRPHVPPATRGAPSVLRASSTARGSTARAALGRALGRGEGGTRETMVAELVAGRWSARERERRKKEWGDNI
jgi:hypothetical protein